MNLNFYILPNSLYKSNRITIEGINTNIIIHKNYFLRFYFIGGSTGWIKIELGVPDVLNLINSLNLIPTEQPVPQTGKIYFDNNLQTLKSYDGTKWKNLFTKQILFKNIQNNGEVQIQTEEIIGVYKSTVISSQSHNLPFNDENNYQQNSDNTKILSGNLQLNGEMMISPENDNNTVFLIAEDPNDNSQIFNDISTGGGIPKLITPVGDIKHSITTSKFGYSSIFFSGNNAYLDLVPSDFPNGTSDRTIDFWVKFIDINTSRVIVAQEGEGTGLNFGLGTYRTKLYFWGHSADASGTTILSNNVWYHVAMTYTAGNAKIYLDGNLEITASGLNPTGIQSFKIGKHTSAWDATDFWGYIDDFRFSDFVRWNSNFTPPQLSSSDIINYPVGNFYAVTTNSISQITKDTNLELVSESINILEILPSGTLTKYLLSFDGRITWKYWQDGFVTTELESANAMISSELQNAFKQWNIYESNEGKIDLAIFLQTTNINLTPTVLNIEIVITQIVYSKAVLNQDYSQTQEKLFSNSQIIKNLSGAANNFLIKYS
ncbi:MAG: hypothetical protein DRQ99_15330 [Candidatus Parabeggiatoa sp. nov. 3]|nr:MAG: hypothetical protein DRQ99_15330 [Gammaproteobacteria bacterium]